VTTRKVIKAAKKQKPRKGAAIIRDGSGNERLVRFEMPPLPFGEVLPPEGLRSATPIQQRLIDAAELAPDQRSGQSPLYQHSVLCQTYMPYRDPGDAVREWERQNGDVVLEVRAGKAMHPVERRLVPVGLPFGPKCRLLLMSINQIAIVKQSPNIEVEDSLTAFVRRVLSLDPNGRNIREVKDQLARLASSDITLGQAADLAGGTTSTTAHLRIVESFDIWFPKDENQRVLWPTAIDLSPTYFRSLLDHAVPLDETHIAALSHSGLCLDIYAWLAQRLHRIPVGKPVHVSWAALHSQFGQGYDPLRINKFRQVFRVALKEVVTLYKEARIDDAAAGSPRLYLQNGSPIWRQEPAGGLTLYSSPPPVRKLPPARKLRALE
jgi:hypothetical protein